VLFALLLVLVVVAAPGHKPGGAPALFNFKRESIVANATATSRTHCVSERGEARKYRCITKVRVRVLAVAGRRRVKQR
jgi:hypothetical protein